MHSARPIPPQLDAAAGGRSEGSSQQATDLLSSTAPPRVESLSSTAQPQDTEACKGAGQAAGETEHAPNAEKQSRRRIVSKGAPSIQEASCPAVDRKEAQALVEEVLGTQTVQNILAHCQSLQSVLDLGGPPADRAQRFFHIFYSRFLEPWRRKQCDPKARADSVSAYISEDAPRIEAQVEKTRPSGDCLFAALTSEHEKDDCRRRIADWMLAHETVEVRLHGSGLSEMITGTVIEFARSAYPTLPFATYCAIMRLPVAEGGVWGEYLEAAVWSEIKKITVKVYMRDGHKFALLGQLAPPGAVGERHIVWNGCHFDRLAPKIDGDASPMPPDVGTAVPLIDSDRRMDTADAGGKEPGSSMQSLLRRAQSLPIVSSELPDRKRRRFQQRVVGWARLQCQEKQWQPQREMLGDEVKQFTLRKAACKACGLSYGRFRQHGHTKLCSGW